MSPAWRQRLVRDPLPALLAADDPALAFLTRRDLLGEPVPPLETLWDLPEPRRLAARQGADGAWPYPGRPGIDPLTNCDYNLLETYRSLRDLVEQYAFDRTHPAIVSAAAFVFSRQRPEGDIRGILGEQYMPYYHGALLELLIKAGFGEDPQVRRGLDWLLGMRQQDGGWVVPAQQVPARQKTNAFWHAPPLPPDRSRPHSHLATGMALRAFAVHPAYAPRPEVLQAAECLAARFFQPDAYLDRKAPSYWLKFQFPFWWTSLLTALDSLSRLGFTCAHPGVAQGLAWFREHQAGDGLWDTGYGSGRRAASSRLWVGLAVCRVLSRLHAKE